MRVYYRSILVLLVLALLAGCRPAAPAPIAPTTLVVPTLAAAAATQVPTLAPTATQVPTLAPTATPAPTAAPTLVSTATPAPTPTPPADDLAGYVAAMRPGFAGDIAANAGLPRYSLRMSINPAAGALSGSEQITFPNRTGAPLADVALRLYQNFARDSLGKGGDVRMNVTGASVGGHPLDLNVVAQRTAVLLPLDPPLAPDQSVTLVVTWTATIKAWGDGTWPLPSYYPILAVHDADGWRLDVTRFPDRVYAESALYEATIDVPASLTIAASGSTIASEQRGGRAIFHIYTGPVREFALTVGDFAVQHAIAGDVAVNVYTARGSPLEARSIARVAAGALADFDRRFGAYPYQELDIHLLIGKYDGGDEYPGLILLYSSGPISASTRYVAAHEVAHQWWYGVIGDDIYRQPWLDEAFAQYSGILYDEDVAGAAVAAADWEREVQRRYRGALADGDLPLGLAISDYRDFNVYYRTVYGKGALFLRALRQQLGDKVFFAALQHYYQNHRYGVATTADVQRAFEDASGRDLSELFRNWVTGL